MLKLLSDSDIATLIERYPTGENINVLAEHFGVTPKFLYGFLSDRGIRRERRQISLTANRAKFADPSFKLFNNLNNTEIGYLAGLFDGEGCISVHQAKHKNKRTGGNYFSDALVVSIGNTDLRLMEWLTIKIPEGRIDEKKPTKLSKKISYAWTLSTIPAAYFCHEIFSYLIIKRDEAELIGSMLRQGFAALNQEQRSHLKNSLRQFKNRSKIIQPSDQAAQVLQTIVE